MIVVAVAFSAFTIFVFPYRSISTPRKVIGGHTVAIITALAIMGLSEAVGIEFTVSELGFMGIMVSPKWDGGGMDVISYALAMEEIARVDASASVVMSVNNSLVCFLLEKFGSDFQKEKYLKPLASGKKIGAYSLSEPQSGSDASNMLTVAQKEGDHYIVSGTKNWVTNGINSDIVMLFAMTETGVGYKGISCFIVEKGWDGFESGKPEDKI